MLRKKELPYSSSLVGPFSLLRAQSRLRPLRGYHGWKESYRSGSWGRMTAWRLVSAGGGDRTGYKRMLGVEMERYR